MILHCIYIQCCKYTLSLVDGGDVAQGYGDGGVVGPAHLARHVQALVVHYSHNVAECITNIT